ncbi:MAG: hypothetical protein AAFR68_00765 [Pseudomonadota bacterium]
MTLPIVSGVLALIVGFAVPRSLATSGYLIAVLVVFLSDFLIRSLSGFAGKDFEESLLLFGGSYAAYFGFNAQVTYRAFALPLLVLSAVFVYRLSREAER